MNDAANAFYHWIYTFEETPDETATNLQQAPLMYFMT